MPPQKKDKKTELKTQERKREKIKISPGGQQTTEKNSRKT